MFEDRSTEENVHVIRSVKLIDNFAPFDVWTNFVLMEVSYPEEAFL